MKKKILIISILVLLLVLLLAVIVSLTLTIVSMNDKDEYSFTVTDENGETAVISSEDIKSSLLESQKLLRDDDETVIATVNGKDITAYELNLKRTAKAFSVDGKEYTEKELLDCIVEDRIIADFVSGQDVITEESEISDIIVSEDVSEITEKLDMFVSASGLTSSELRDMSNKNDERINTYKTYIFSISELLANGEMPIEDERVEDLWSEFLKLTTSEENLENADWDAINECWLEIKDIFTQKLIDEADIVIYEDRLN